MSRACSLSSCARVGEGSISGKARHTSRQRRHSASGQLRMLRTARSRKSSSGASMLMCIQ